MAGEEPTELEINNRAGINYSFLIDYIQESMDKVKTKLEEIKDAGDSVSIGNMFDMQLLMNRLSQISEMSTSVLSAANTAITSMARNVK